MNQSLNETGTIEKRGKPRMKCAYKAIVKGSLPDGIFFEENATVLDMSASGIFVMLNYLIQKGQDLSVKIAFPTGSLELGSPKLNLNGVVVRTDAISAGVLGAAITFQEYQFE